MERKMNDKPKREDFRTDDEFGEAYGYWMVSTSKAVPKTVVPTPQRPRPPQFAKPIPVIVNPARSPMSARFEADRDTWNHSTKARFQRAAANAAAKDPSEKEKK
jgi:hypothetical protein